MSRLPLCTRDQVQAELDDTVRRINQLLDRPCVDRDRRDQALATSNRWRHNLTLQLAEMDAQVAA